MSTRFTEPGIIFAVPTRAPFPERDARLRSTCAVTVSGDVPSFVEIGEADVTIFNLRDFELLVNNSIA